MDSTITNSVPRERKRERERRKEIIKTEKNFKYIPPKYCPPKLVGKVVSQTKRNLKYDSNIFQNIQLLGKQ